LSRLSKILNNVDDLLRRLGKRIREVRIERGFASQDALGDYLKMHRSFIGHLENGRKDFRLTTIMRVAEALGVPLSELFAAIEDRKDFKEKSAPRSGTTRHYALMKDVAVLERTVQRLRATIASEKVRGGLKPSGGDQRHAAKKKRR
jgi:transcriptional regulator with XRE-family HTH domain